MYRHIINSCILFLTLFALVSCGNNATPTDATGFQIIVTSSLEEEEYSKEIANGIITALEEYKSSHGFYPVSLNELEYEFLSRIPTTATNQQFDYSKLNPSPGNYWSYFVIGFELSLKKGIGCYYHQGNKLWECGRLQAP